MIEPRIEIDSFIIASARRKIVLYKRRDPIKPYVVGVFIRDRVRDPVGSYSVELSTSEYYHLDTARLEFEQRRPNMRDGTEDFDDGPMQKGKRLVQETFRDKLV